MHHDATFARSSSRRMRATRDARVNVSRTRCASRATRYRARRVVEASRDGWMIAHVDDDSRAASRRVALALGAALASGSGWTSRASGADVGGDVDVRAVTRADDVALERYEDADDGYALDVPVGWVKDLPNGIAEVEFHPRSEYGGRRFRVQVRPYGKKVGSRRLDELEEAEFASARAYAEDVARKYAPLEGEGSTSRGQAVSKVLSSRMSDDGRYYYFEYATESMLPLHFWGVVALGPGPVGSARKLGRKDLITLTCQMPEDKGPEAAALLERIVSTFRILDV